ncbi:hypothetical protein [Atopococcus tabaci]|uniref:hypothetical protein n=1 Tax=Atopococcus tabaci TaxID=269774 RepID=UPI0004890FA0|nr:hypothetical protein [Atopococcus tabaci]
MGQYYWTLNIDRKERLNPLLYGQGLKMVEHMWAGNSFLYELLHLLAGDWKGDRLFHHGDYAEDIPEEFNFNYQEHTGSILTYDPYDGYTFLKDHWVEKMDDLWNQFAARHVLVNYDKMVYCEINCRAVASSGDRICPLPLLLSDSNVIASGDYTAFSDYRSLRSWTYNRIGVEPREASILLKMNEIEYNFAW